MRSLNTDSFAFPSPSQHIFLLEHFVPIWGNIEMSVVVPIIVSKQTEQEFGGKESVLDCFHCSTGGEKLRAVRNFFENCIYPQPYRNDLEQPESLSSFDSSGSLVHMRGPSKQLLRQHPVRTWHQRATPNSYQCHCYHEGGNVIHQIKPI